MVVNGYTDSPLYRVVFFFLTDNSAILRKFDFRLFFAANRYGIVKDL